MARQLPKPKLEVDIRLLGEGVPEKTLHEIVALRYVADMVADPEQSMSPERLAKRTGFSVQEILHVLRQPAFAEILREDMMAMQMGFLQRGANAIQKILDDPDHKPADRIAAYRAQLNAYEVVARATPYQAQGEARVTFEKIMDKLRKLPPVKELKEPEK